jgi:general secretion pathway protein N
MLGWALKGAMAMSIRPPAMLLILFAFGFVDAQATAPQLVDPRDDLFAPDVLKPNKTTPDANPTDKKSPRALDPAPIAKPVPPVEPAAVKAEPAANPLWVIPLSAFTETRSRPIFLASRRPPQAVTVAKPAVVAAPSPKPVEPIQPQLSLVGTIVGSGRRVGIFVNSADKSTFQLKTGDKHNGWVLRSVETHQVELANGLDTAVLKLPPIDMKPVAGAPALSPPVAATPPQGMPVPYSPANAGMPVANVRHMGVNVPVTATQSLLRPKPVR